MMKRTRGSLTVLAIIAALALPAFGSVEIEFTNSSANGNDGFRISRAAPSGMSDRLAIGEDAASSRPNLSFLHVSGATSSTGGTEVSGFLVTLPSFRLGAGSPGPSPGVDLYNLTFDDATTNSIGGFAIYDPNNLAQGPVLQANLRLTEHLLLTLGSSGAIESTIDVNLTNIQTPTGNFPTLTEFRNQANAGGGGADFVVSISSAGSNLSQHIMAGDTVAGDAGGSIAAPVPEPGTILLIAAGAVLSFRRGRRFGSHAQ